METFERENRYIVLKRKYLAELPDELQIRLKPALEDAAQLMPKLDCVVVESDWPEFEPTWQAIERRVSGATWDGDGLPPAGAIVEFTLNAGKTSWEKGEVIGPDGDHQVVIKHGNSYHARNRHSVRKIRTAEQIADDERAKAAIEMAGVIGGVESMRDQEILNALALAGYRKPVKP